VTEAASHSLDSIALFEPLSPSERQTLAQQCRWRRYAPQEQVFDRSDDARDVYFIVEGLVRIVDYSFSGREISFDDISAGIYFGHLAAIDNLPRSAGVIALTDSLLATMSQNLFERTVTGHPELALDIMRNMAAMVRRSTERIMDLSTLGANNRVHAEILRLARASMDDEDAPTAVISPIPVHSDIASRVSTTRETVARVFGELAKSGLVQRRSQQLFVSDFERLEQLVEDVRGGDF
jgi:CRP-like cAMP-binding protein